MTVLALLAGLAAAQSPSKIIELRVPEPTLMPPMPPPPSPPPEEALAAPAGSAPAGAPSGGGARSPAHAKAYARDVQGISPATLWGRYQVVEVTEGGETEQYAEKMARTRMALQSDCVTVGTVFDFGKEAAGLPNQVQIAEYRHCTKGGLGTYASELALALPATFEATPGGLRLELPAVQASGSLVRVRATQDDLSTPSHWMGPVVQMTRPLVKYTVVAEFGRNADKDTPATVIHLVTSADGSAGSADPAAASGRIVLHLEPVPDPNAWMQPEAPSGR